MQNARSAEAPTSLAWAWPLVLAGVVAVLAAPPAARGAAPREAYAPDLAAFFDKVDATYTFFDLKGNREDWAATKRQLAAKVMTCRSDAEFLSLIVEAIHCLRDAHMGLRSDKAKPPPPPPQFYAGMAFMPGVKNSVVVMSPPPGRERDLPVGTVVTEIDGRDAREVLEDRAKKAWEAGGPFSSPQRARLFEYRIPLRGKRGERHAFTVLAGQARRTLALAANVEARGWPHAYNQPAGLTRVGQTFFYRKLPGGAGYIYIRSVDESTEQGLAQALAKLPDARGWIIDLCGNGGGGYSEGLIEKLKAIPRPVAVLIDAGCISAGETLARDLVQLAGARLFGLRTAGASSAKTQWQFPSGIAWVTFSVRSRWRGDRKPIEFNGIDPDEEVEAVPEEVARGLNSAICRAEEYLKEKH